MISGTLKNAFLVETSDGKLVAVGNIFGDAKGRFDDGESIKTSYIISENNNVIHTKNSSYEVEWSNTTPISWDSYIKMRGH